MEKRYQVFVSSTFQDLQEERSEVMQALLELDCIPSGMELFPAANEDQWTLIQKVIADCDYYVVIVAGRYGSIGPSQLSYTEMEYRYALALGKPVIGFLHKHPEVIPAGHSEHDPDKATKLAGFRSFVQQKMCKFWESPHELGSQVSRSIVRLIKSSPAVGWVRGDQVTSEAGAREILRLKNRIEELEAQESSLSSRGPAGIEKLAQGEDTLEIHGTAETYHRQKGHETFSLSAVVTWNQLFAAISPLMIHEASAKVLADGLTSLLSDEVASRLVRLQKGDRSIRRVKVDSEDSHTIQIQLKALGLITMSRRNRSVHDTSTYWSLTPYGDTVMTRLRAIAKPQAGAGVQSRGEDDDHEDV